MQDRHPCFSTRAHSRYARIHLPVSPKCNLGCRYCERRVGGPSYHSYRPAVCSRIVSPEDALALVEEALGRYDLKVAGIAGPGEPLYNEETFRTLELVGGSHPDLILCLSTNGLMLPESVGRLHALGLSTLTVTVNAMRPSVAERIYGHAIVHGERLTGPVMARTLIRNQFRGLRAAVRLGVAAKVNTILIPGVNEGEVSDIARRSARAGACLHNITPLIPLGAFSGMRGPTCHELQRARDEAGRFLDQFTLCRQCRADSVGVPGRGDGLPLHHPA